MEKEPLFRADLTPGHKPVIHLTLPTEKFGVFFTLNLESLAQAQDLATALNDAVISIVPIVPFPS